MRGIPRRGAVTLVAVLLSVLLVAACGGSSAAPTDDTGSSDTGISDTGISDTAPGSATTSDTSGAPAAFQSLHLNRFWVLSLLPCTGTNLPAESQIPLPSSLQDLLVLCRPTTGGAAHRLVNISKTSLRVTYDAGAASATYRPADEDPLTQASLRLAGAGFREVTEVMRTEVTFPAGSSVILAPPQGAELPDLEVSTDPELGQKALFVRTATDLFGQLPWSDLGDMEAVAGKLAACAGGTLAAVQTGKVDSLKDAFDTVKACADAADDLSTRWQEKVSAAPDHIELRARLGTEAAAADQAADDVARLVRKGLTVVVRR